METPVILTSSGNTVATQATCKHIEKAVTQSFPDNPVYWGFNHRTVARNQTGAGTPTLQHPATILKQLADEGYRNAIVQSLHLLPGHEFHTLQREVRHTQVINYQIGLPLLSSQRDYLDYIDLVTPLVTSDSAQAVLFVGHGTRHPIWTAYLALEALLQKRFGKKTYVGVVEHSPNADDIERRILEAGYQNVLIIPFFLVAGMHFHRDVKGTADHSWYSRLSASGLKVDFISEGVGLLDKIGDLVVRHIQEAENHLAKK